MSNTRCMRTSSNRTRTGFRMWHSFRSPPLAFSSRRQERMEPRPELSTNSTLLRSKMTCRFVSRMGAIADLNAPALLVSRFSPGRVTTVTSSILSIFSSSFVSSGLGPCSQLHQREAVSTQLILVVVCFIHALLNDIEPKSALS